VKTQREAIEKLQIDAKTHEDNAERMKTRLFEENNKLKTILKDIKTDFASCNRDIKELQEKLGNVFYSFSAVHIYDISFNEYHYYFIRVFVYIDRNACFRAERSSGIVDD
jgi:hypothetical protein